MEHAREQRVKRTQRDYSFRQIKEYKLSSDMRAVNDVQALHMAMKHMEDRAAMMIHHLDRGSQYCSDLYQTALQSYNIHPSMTDVYLAKRCFSYQNALAEQVNGILKQEFFNNTL